MLKHIRFALVAGAAAAALASDAAFAAESGDPLAPADPTADQTADPVLGPGDADPAAAAAPEAAAAPASPPPPPPPPAASKPAGKGGKAKAAAPAAEPPPAADQVAQPETVEVEVAPRRTVVTAVDGKEVEYGPGAVITLPIDEAIRLRWLGYLVDPNRPPAPVAEGPTFDAGGGPTITQG